MSELAALPRKRGRPKKISDATWEQVKQAKIAGCSNKEICKDFGVSLASLMRFLDTKLTRAEIVVGQGGTAFEIVSALTDAALGAGSRRQK